MAAKDQIGRTHSSRLPVRNTDDKSTIPRATVNRFAIVAAAAIGGFLLGYASMWLTSQGYQTELDAVSKTLRPSVLQNELATAALAAHRGELEQARLQTSSFFTNLRAEVERDESAFAREQRSAIHTIIQQRDETITMLARDDPASADHLSELYFNFVKLKNSSGRAGTRQ